MLLWLCCPGGSLLSIEDPQEGMFIQQNLELLQDGAKSFWIGLYKSHEGECGLPKCLAVPFFPAHKEFNLLLYY